MQQRIKMHDRHRDDDHVIPAACGKNAGAMIAGECVGPIKPVFRRVAAVALMVGASIGASFAASESTDNDIVVRVDTHGPVVVVDVEAPVRATTMQAWEVLTDYAHMAQFVSNLRLSEVVREDGDRLEVHQVGAAGAGPLQLSFETTRLVELAPPDEIRSTLLKGEFKSYKFSTKIVQIDPGVLISNHGEYVPNRWLPPVIGPALIRTETRKQYGEIRAEILRRARHS